MTEINSLIPTSLVDMEKVDANTVVGVSGGGDIWRKFDGGLNWNLVWTGEGDLPGDGLVKFTNSSFGTVVGERFAYMTKDGGQTWTRLGRGAAFEANGLVSFGDDTIVTTGHHGYVQRMTDSGPWDVFSLDPPTFGRDTSFSAASAVGTDFIYTAGHWGSLARSTDGGLNWQVLNGAVSLNFYANDVKFTSQQEGWLTGWDYSVGIKRETLQTHDGGLTWQVVPNGNFPGIGIEVIGARVWIQSGGQTQWRSIDGGATFTALQVPSNSGSTPSVADVSFADSSVGYICGYDGYLARTLNGGATWTQLGSVNVNTHNRGVLAQLNELWVCGARSGGGNAFIRRSLDEGLTWQTWNIGGQYTTPYKMVRTPTKLYVSGYNGEIWRMDGLAPTPTPTSFVSRKTHGTAGTFDINLPLAGEPGVESRSTGGNHTLVVTFTNAMVSGSASVTNGAGSIAGNPTFNGNTMTINLTGVADMQKVTVMLSNVTDSFAQVMAEMPVTLNVLAGDTNGNKTVNASDVGMAKAQSGIAVTAANFRADVNASGSINGSDVGQVKASTGHSVP